MKEKQEEAQSKSSSSHKKVFRIS